MPRAKKETKVSKKTQTKKSTKVVEEKQAIGTSRIKKEEPTVDVFAEFKEELKKELYKEIREQVIAENKRLEHIEKTKEKVEATITKSELVLSGVEVFRFTGTKDGLNVSKNETVMQSFNKGGAVGIGTTSPNAIGTGSVNNKSNYNSEASLPNDGKGQVRGLLVESDDEDSKPSFFRGVDRREHKGVIQTC